MKRVLFVAIMFMVLLSGCSKEIRNKCREYRRSFVAGFGRTESVELNDFSMYGDRPEISFNILLSAPWFSYASTGTKKEIYDSLCEKYGDMTYNRKGPVFPCYDPRSPIENFVSVEIVSDADYDEQHPAGTSLADLCIFDAWSAKPYVDSGYEVYEYEVNGRRYNSEVYPITKKVSDLVADDFILLMSEASGTDGFLRFDSLPTISKEHTFTVTFTDEFGMKFSDTIEMIFM